MGYVLFCKDFYRMETQRKLCMSTVLITAENIEVWLVCVVQSPAPAGRCHNYTILGAFSIEDHLKVVVFASSIFIKPSGSKYLADLIERNYHNPKTLFKNINAVVNPSTSVVQLVSSAMCGFSAFFC